MELKEKKILIVAYSRQAGGAEKSALKLQSALLAEGYPVEFGTFIQSSKDFYPFNINSQNHSFFPSLNLFLTKHNKRNPLVLLMILRDLLDFRRRVSKAGYDVVISFGAGVGCVTFVGLFSKKILQITSERINPDPKVYRPSFFSQLLRPYIYKNGVVCSVQTRGFASWVESHWGVKPIVTPNHFEIPSSSYEFPRLGSPLIAVGRPAFQKGYDILIQAWKIVEDHQSQELWIVANDKDNYIANLISDSNCKNIKVLPLSTDLNNLFNNCSAFISTSRFEGYPNAIAEAIIFGIPVITTLNSDVVYEWEKDGICISIPDLIPATVAKTVLSIINDEQQLRELSSSAILQRDKFGWDHNKVNWLRLIEGSSDTA
jgi:GalNAc-alpha-(1->4)-GalNAc-alpha-(1->3)-diNAcBac-PP-undecaprenol alpha-1,4-N-acetyl-D-galactosaminyltransferase